MELDVYTIDNKNYLLIDKIYNYLYLSNEENEEDTLILKEDVNNKLEQHLRNETYGESIPKLYFLTKYLIPTEQKGIKKEYNVYCPICGKYVNLEQYEDHYVKCNRTKLMVDDIKTYYNQNLDFDKIINLSDESYEKLYKKYLNMMLDADIPYYRKNLILKILYPDTELNVKDVISNIGG